MLAKTKNSQQTSLFLKLEEQLNQQNPIYKLANKIDWTAFEIEFRKFYCHNNGRLAKPIRRMVGLLALKYLRNLSDESVVEQWAENAHYPYCGETEFTTTPPCNATELVHFRHRIGQKGVELILKESISVNGDDQTGKGDNIAFIDSTVQKRTSSTQRMQNYIERSSISAVK